MKGLTCQIKILVRLDYVGSFRKNRAGEDSRAADLKRKGIMKELQSQERKDSSTQDVFLEWVSKELLNKSNWNMKSFKSRVYSVLSLT